MQRIAIALFLAGLGLGAGARAEAFRVQRVVTGLDRPVFATSAKGGFGRLFLVEQHTGQIRILIIPSGVLLATPFLTVPGVSQGEEQGLLGLAFDPQFLTNGYFYVSYTDPDRKIVRYHVSADANVADPASATPVLSYAQPDSNHNGGWIGFGPDGYLYIATGDGGGADDDGTGHTAGTGNAQDITDNLLGKILRIDVRSDDFPADPARNYAIPPSNPFVGVTGDDEIWAYGLRNPWRPSFDRANGNFYIADVGQNVCEEVDVHPAASPAGVNYGWRLREGTIQTPDFGIGGAKPADAIDPIFDYPHPQSVCSLPGHGDAYTGYVVTGGYVYRGPITSLRGRYFFADFATAHLWSLIYDGSAPATFDGTNYASLVDHSIDPAFAPSAGTIDTISSFGEDGAGNLYVLDLFDGDVFRLPEPHAIAAQIAGAGLVRALASRRSRGRGC
jgi:glucose/arabinose dehydrogenase